MLNFWIAAALVLIRRSLILFPLVNLKVERPALFVQEVPLPTTAQSKFILPLMRLLSDEGLMRLVSVPTIPARRVK